MTHHIELKNQHMPIYNASIIYMPTYKSKRGKSMRRKSMRRHTRKGGNSSIIRRGSRPKSSPPNWKRLYQECEASKEHVYAQIGTPREYEVPRPQPLYEVHRPQYEVPRMRRRGSSSPIYTEILAPAIAPRMSRAPKMAPPLAPPELPPPRALKFISKTTPNYTLRNTNSVTNL
jgi:hypothetical protein